jgi:hypothetical protein
MEAQLRDSSLDYRTYWLQDGQYYSRRGLGASEACVLPEDKLNSIPEDDRQVILEETNADPAFCAAVAKCMATQPDWAHRISASAKQAIANEIDPTKYPERKGTWPRLRARTQDLLKSAKDQASSDVSKLTFDQKVAVVKKIAAGAVLPKSAPGLGSLGQWDIIGSLIGTAANIGAAVYSANVTASAQRDIAQMQTDQAIQSAQAQMAVANAQAAIAAANAQMSSNPLSSAAAAITSGVSAVTTGTVAGIPAWIPLAAGAMTLAYFAGKG